MTLWARLRRSFVGTAAASALLFGTTFSSQTTSSTAQNPPPPAGQAPATPRQPVFRGGANFVLVDAYPQRDGRLVEGLTAADFEVREDGKPQQVEMFEFVRVEPSLSETTRRDPNNQREAEALVADPHNRVFVVYLDTIHTTVEGSHNIRGPLVDALNRIIGPNDLFGVMTPNMDPRHIAFGRRLLGVEEQLTRHWTWGERNRVGSDPQDPGEEDLYQCFACKPVANGCVDWYYDEGARRRYLYEVLIDRRREDRTLTSIERLIDHLGRLREARTVVLAITDGWLLYQRDQRLAEEGAQVTSAAPTVTINPGGRIGIAGLDSTRGIDRASCNSELTRLALLDNEIRMRDLLRSANRGNVSFYPVTPSGLGVFDRPISQRDTPNPNNKPGESPFLENITRVGDRVNTLRTLAENTDGIADVNTNDLKAGLQRVIDDVSAYYLLGYYSTNMKFDGKVRTIQVRMKPAGLNVRARRSYLAPSEASLRAEATAAPSTAASAASVVEESLGILARLRPTSELFIYGVQEDDAASVVVEIASSLMSGGRWSSGGDVEVTLTGPNGQTVGAGQGRVEPATRGALVRIPLTAAAVGPLRVAVRVRSGSERLEERGEIRPTPGKVVGGPLLFRGTAAASSPLRPVADFQYRRTERAHIEWPTLAPLDRREARLLGRNGQPLAIPVTVTERQTNGRNVLAADVNLAPLTEGDYVIELTVGSAGETEQRRLAIRVIR
jgi:VWFA-related protein